MSNREIENGLPEDVSVESDVNTGIEEEINAAMDKIIVDLEDEELDDLGEYDDSVEEPEEVEETDAEDTEESEEEESEEELPEPLLDELPDVADISTAWVREPTRPSAVSPFCRWKALTAAMEPVP